MNFCTIYSALSSSKDSMDSVFFEIVKTPVNTTLPKMSPLNPRYKTKKQTVFQKITAFVDKFKRVGGQV